MNKQFCWILEVSDDKETWWPRDYGWSRRDAEAFRDMRKAAGLWKYYRVVKFVRAGS